MKYDWDNLSEEQKQLAVKREMELVTHNGTTKDDFINIIHFLQGTIEAQQLEIDRLYRWVSDLQRGTYVNCVYCGHRYGPEDEVPASMADVLKEHIENCPEHPMPKLKQENERLKAQAVAMREAFKEYHLTYCSSEYCDGDCLVDDCALKKLGILCLSSDAGKDYHNPADLGALKKVQEVLKALDIRGGLGYEKHAWIREALAAIEKAIGSDTP